MNEKTKPSSAALGVASQNVWMTDEYNLSGYKGCLEGHEPRDKEAGYTAVYCWCADRPDMVNDAFTYPEMKKLVPLLDKSMWTEVRGYLYVNQHAVHSLRQLMCNIQDQWNKHSDRMSQIEHLPSGRIPPMGTVT